MADGQTTYPVQRDITPELDDVDGFKFVSFEKGEEMDSFVKCQHKRGTTRPLSFTTLSLTKDCDSRLKKRNRKDNKRVVVDKLDGFTFVSAFSLNDFDTFDKNRVKPSCNASAPTKRKSTTIAELETSNKKARKPLYSTPNDTDVTFVSSTEVDTKVKSLSTSPENAIVPSVGSACKGRNNLKTNKSPLGNETVSNASSCKNLSPLTKSALVRLKKINVNSLNQNKNITRTEQVQDLHDNHKEHGKVNQTNIPANKAKKSINLKVPLMEIDKLNLSGIDISKKPKISPIVVSDSEDNVELDVCNIDESSSSSQFILDNMKNIEEKTSVPVEDEYPKKEERSKPKRKPCRICSIRPCRIVGAKRVKNSEHQFPSFEVSFTSTCKVHLPGEVVVHDSSQPEDPVDVCIQATTTDIKMHLDFAKRFPYRVISILSCQPRLGDDLKLPDISFAENSERSNENHRIIEQKRREELHGLYCKLAETLAVSKIRASKLWILENALKEIRCLEAESTFLSAKLNLEKDENQILRKRWEELSGKPYVPPEGNTVSKAATKSKLLELYEKYRRDVRQELRTEPPQVQENLKSKQEEIREESSCNIEKRTANKPVTPITVTKNILKPSNSLMKLSGTLSRIEKDNDQNTPTRSSSESRVSFSVNPNQVGHQAKDRQPISTDQVVTSVKHTSTGPRLIVRPFQHKPISPKPPSTPVIPKIDLTNQPETSASKLFHLLEGSSTPGRTKSTHVTQLTNSPPFKSPPPTRSIALNATDMRSTRGSTDQSAALPMSSRAQSKQLSPPSSVAMPNSEFVMISMMVKGRPMIFRIPKTAEGLTMLSQISLMKKLSPDSMSKIVGQFFSPIKNDEATIQATGMATSQATVNTSQIITPATPTRWSTVATAQDHVTSPQVTTQRDDQLSSTPNINSNFSGVSQQQKQLIFLDMTSKGKPKAKNFTVIPTSSSINVTLNKLGSITANKVFNKSPTASTSHSNLSRASDHQILNQNVPGTTLSKTLPFTNVPTSVPYTKVVTSRPPTSVHIYPVAPQIPPDSLCPLDAVPKISDSLLQDACQSDQDDMNDSGICMISNVFSLTDTAVGETFNSSKQTTEVHATIDAALTVSSTIQSPNALGSVSTRGDENV